MNPMLKSTKNLYVPALLIILITSTINQSAMAQQDVKEEYSVPFQLGGGWEQFDNNCSQCHGKWAGGTDQGPPLLHSYYLPGHHGDESFYRAIKNGSRAHHWGFGDMPAISGLSDESAREIIALVRWSQRESGLLK